ncbi:MAG: hypothetical protein Q9161_005761 [Pseudevernia consocians]
MLYRTSHKEQDGKPDLEPTVPQPQERSHKAELAAQYQQGLTLGVLLGEKEKTARLEAQLEAAQLEKEQLKSASRIKELEQEIDILKADMRLSAGKPDGQAVQNQAVESTGSSDAVLRAELAQMQKQIAEKDMINCDKRCDNCATIF